MSPICQGQKGIDVMRQSYRTLYENKKAKTKSQTYSETVLFLIGRLSVTCQYMADNKYFRNILQVRTGKIFRGRGKFILLENSKLS